MLTRRKLRRGACWSGVGLGAAAGLALAVSLLTTLTLGSPVQSLVLKGGALGLYSRPAAYTSPRDGVLNPSDVEDVLGCVVPAWSGFTAARGYGRLVVPLWMPIGLGLLCLYWLTPEGPARGTCECGYDLRTVPRKDGAVTCPECGRVAADGAASGGA